MGEPGRPQCHGRNQFVLDYSKPEVVEGIGDMIGRFSGNRLFPIVNGI
ncbi:MAG: hypothetical protein ACLR2E_03890 [Lachnospiraceae bacterium]